MVVFFLCRLHVVDLTHSGMFFFYYTFFYIFSVASFIFFNKQTNEHPCIHLQCTSILPFLLFIFIYFKFYAYSSELLCLNFDPSLHGKTHPTGLSCVVCCACEVRFRGRSHGDGAGGGGSRRGVWSTSCPQMQPWPLVSANVALSDLPPPPTQRTSQPACAL